MASQPIFRFAPSPNGYLHLGHAFSALFTRRAAEAAGGVTLLRIEDIDITRCKPEFAAGIFEDLAWLGLVWPEPVLIQSQRFPLYAEHAARLSAESLLYPCFCSRSDIAAVAVGTDPDGAPLYAGTCRRLDAKIIAMRNARGDQVQYRLDMTRAKALAGALRFDDISSGVSIRHSAEPELYGDVVLQRLGTSSSYHLSVVVDDALQGVTHVTRGRDMEAGTSIHVLLQKLLGLPTPLYAFHSLILGADGKKLAKSKDSPSLRDLRAQGWTAEDVRRELGF